MPSVAMSRLLKVLTCCVLFQATLFGIASMGHQKEHHIFGGTPKQDRPTSELGNQRPQTWKGSRSFSIRWVIGNHGAWGLDLGGFKNTSPQEAQFKLPSIKSDAKYVFILHKLLSLDKKQLTEGGGVLRARGLAPASGTDALAPRT